MAREEIVRRALGIGPHHRLLERGVYRPNLDEELTKAPSGSRTEGLAPGETVLGPEWLDDEALEHMFSSDDRLTAALPGEARVTRADIEPRVLLFEHLPVPSNTLGNVRPLAANRWVLDSRNGPVGLHLPYPDYDIIVWGERGEVRLFTVRPH